MDLFYWWLLPRLKKFLVRYTNIQPCYFYVRRSVSQKNFHNASNLQSNYVRFHIVPVSVFDEFKWGSFGNITPYKIIVCQGYKKSDQYLKKVRLTGWISLWSSKTRIFLFVILSFKIMLSLKIHKCSTLCIFQIVYCTWEDIVKFSFPRLKIFRDNVLLPKFSQENIYIRVICYWYTFSFRRDNIS